MKIICIVFILPSGSLMFLVLFSKWFGFRRYCVFFVGVINSHPRYSTTRPADLFCLLNCQILRLNFTPSFFEVRCFIASRTSRKYIKFFTPQIWNNTSRIERTHKKAAFYIGFFQKYFFNRLIYNHLNIK